MPYSVFPTGTTIYKPEKAYNCYVLHEGRDGRSYLIDMNGITVHSWPYTGFPVEMIDPEINQGRRGDVFCQKEPVVQQHHATKIQHIRHKQYGSPGPQQMVPSGG